MTATRAKRCKLCKRKLSPDRVPRDRQVCAWHIPWPQAHAKRTRARKPRPLAGGRPR